MTSQALARPVAWTPEALLVVGTGVLQLLLAGVLLRLRFFDRANRALALLLVLRGGFFLFGGLSLGLDQPRLWERLSSYAFLAYFPAIAYLAAVYPRPRRWLPPAPWAAAPFLAAMAVLAVLFAATGAPEDAAGLTATFRDDQGWPDAFTAVAELLFPVAALVWARDALAMPAGSRRSSVLLVGIAFMLIDLYDNVYGAGLDARFGAPSAIVAGVTWLNLALFGALAVILARVARQTPDAALRKGLHRYLAAMALAVASGLAMVPLAPDDSNGPGEVLGALWDLALPVLLTYALLRHQLFDIDLRVKWTIRQSTIAGAFIGVFFVVSEGAQQFAADDTGLGLGPYVGIAATGLLVFALAPLQQAAERVANAALPNTRAPQEMTADERRALYRHQAALAWADGSLSVDERHMLDGLRGHLRLEEADAAALEREALAGARRSGA